MVYKKNKTKTRPRTRAEAIRDANIARREKIKQRDAAMAESRRVAIERAKVEAENKRIEQENLKIQQEYEEAKKAEFSNVRIKTYQGSKQIIFVKSNLSREQIFKYYPDLRTSQVEVWVGGADTEALVRNRAEAYSVGSPSSMSALQEKARIRTYERAVATGAVKPQEMKTQYTVGGLPVSEGFAKKYEKEVVVPMEQEEQRKREVEEGWERLTPQQKAVVGASATFSKRGFETWGAIIAGEKEKAVQIAKEHYIEAAETDKKSDFIIKTSKGAIWGTPTGRLGVMIGATKITSSAAAIPAVGKVMASGAGKLAFKGATAYYVGSKSLTAKEIYESGDKSRAAQFILETGTEVGGLAIGSRMVIKEQVLKKVYQLPKKQQTEVLTKMKQVEQLKAVKPTKVKLETVQRLPKEGAPVVKEYLKGRGRILGGSVAEQTQLVRKGILKPEDIDVYVSWYRKPTTEAKLLGSQLKAAGVKARVIGSKIYTTKAGVSTKTIEIHPASDFLVSNIRTVEGVFDPVFTKIKTTPEGIKVLGIKTQLKRELIAGYVEGSAKHFERFPKTYADVAAQQPKKIDFTLPKIGKGTVMLPFSKVSPITTTTLTPEKIKAAVIPKRQIPSYTTYPRYTTYIPYKDTPSYKPYKETPTPYKPVIIPKPYSKSDEKRYGITEKKRITPPYRPTVKPPAYYPIKKPTPYPTRAVPKAPKTSVPYTPRGVKRVTVKKRPTPYIQYKPKTKAPKQKPRPIRYPGTPKYKPSLIGVLEQRKIYEEPRKKQTGFGIRAILTSKTRKRRR